MPFEIDRSLYARMYGPTVGDRVRLGDTNLLVEVERDEASARRRDALGLRQDHPRRPADVRASRPRQRA